jgi:hypothetical protein
MASLIQDHAEAIRDDLRRVRGEPPLDAADAEDEVEPPEGAANAAGAAGAVTAGAAAAAADGDGDEPEPPHGAYAASAGEAAIEAVPADDRQNESIEADAPAQPSNPVADAEVEPAQSHDDVVDLSEAGAHEAPPSVESGDGDGDDDDDGQGFEGPRHAATEPSADDDEPADDAAQTPVFGTAVSSAEVAGDAPAPAPGDSDHDEDQPTSVQPAWFDGPDPSDAGDEHSGPDAAPAPWDEAKAAASSSMGDDDAPNPGTGSGPEAPGSFAQADATEDPGLGEEDRTGDHAAPDAPADGGADAGAHPAAVGATVHQSADAAQATQGSSAQAIGGPPPGWEPKPARATDHGDDDQDDEAGGRSLRELFWGED